jgi:hypothetical protein
MMRVTPRLGSLVLCAALAACGDAAMPVPHGQAWPTGVPLDVGGPVWALGHTVHLGAEGAIDTRYPIAEFAVAGDAVWFLREDPDVAGEEPDRRLWRATREMVEPAGVRAAEVAATSDGRYLVYLDDVSGPKDRYGDVAWVLVVVDTRTGQETLRSSEGMDDAGVAGLAEGYEDHVPYLAAVTDQTAYVRAIGRMHAYDLATGDVDRVGESRVPRSPGEEGVTGEPAPPVWNTAHTWAIQSRESPQPEVLLAGDGRLVTPGTGTPDWTLLRWLDDDTVLARGRWTLEPASDLGETDRTVLLTCDVPAASCEQVPGTMREARQSRVLLPNGAGD